MSNIGRGISPHPDDQDTGTIPDIRSHKVMRPERGLSPEDLFYIKVKTLMDTLMNGLPVDCRSVSFIGDGWNMAIATEDDGNRELIGHFHNEPGQKSTTFSATQPSVSGVACASYTGPNDVKPREGDTAFDEIINTIKPHLRQRVKPTTLEEATGR